MVNEQSRKADMEGITDEEAREVIRKGSRRITGDDIETVVERADDIEKKTHGPLARFMGDIKLLIALVKDYWNKSYREVPWWTIAAAVTSLLYVLNPMDIVPDFIPFIGLLDDAAVVSACLFMLERDLARYNEWKKAHPAGDTD